MHRGGCHPSGTGTAKAILGMPLDAALRLARAILAVGPVCTAGNGAGCTVVALLALGRRRVWKGREVLD